MQLNTTQRAFGLPASRHLIRLRKLIAPALAVCLAATASAGYAQTVAPASTSTPIAAQPLAMATAHGAFQPVKFLPQHNSRPAPPPNRTSFTKPPPPPHHA
jgi:hypothetical protein